MHHVPQGPAKQMRMFVWCPLFPHTFASSAVTCSNERAGHTGHPYFLLPDAAVLSSSLAQPPHSLSHLCWARIFISVLGDLPPSNSVRCGACFVLSLGSLTKGTY